MNTLAKFLGTAFALLIGLPVHPLLGAVAVGQPAPDFTLTDINGKKHSLSEYRGRIVVLEWNNPDCPFVHKHYESGNLPRLQHDAMADGVVWLLINSAAPGLQGGDYTAGELASWLKQHGAAPTDYFRDPDGRVGHLYGAKVTPHMFVVDATGTLVYDGAIDSISSTRKSDIAKATNYVRNALAALMEGRAVEPSITHPYGCSVKYGSKG
ncbi:MAG TPA: redoxin domain-containing protein [Opitutaceae bacterium]|nr:redoxin domain-containing protein [Opitutaceae bacterium]